MRSQWAQGTVVAEMRGFCLVLDLVRTVSSQPLLAWRQADDWNQVGYHTSPAEASRKQRTPCEHSWNSDSTVGKKNSEFEYKSELAQFTRKRPDYVFCSHAARRAPDRNKVWLDSLHTRACGQGRVTPATPKRLHSLG